MGVHAIYVLTLKMKIVNFNFKLEVGPACIGRTFPVDGKPTQPSTSLEPRTLVRARYFSPAVFSSLPASSSTV